MDSMSADAGSWESAPFSISPQDFLNTVSSYTQQTAPDTSATKPVKLATVMALGSSNTVQVQFDGETITSTKFYPCLTTYGATLGDRVALMPTGTTYLVIGAVGAPPVDLGIGVTNFVTKTANLDRASTTTLADDNELKFTAEASATYLVEFYLFYAAIGAAKFKTAWTVPSGATGSRSATGLSASVSNSTSTPDPSGGLMRSGSHNFTTSVTYGDRDSATNLCFALETSTVVTTSSGLIAIQWAQGTSSTTASRLSAQSNLRYTRVA